MPNIREVEKYWDNQPCNIKHSNAPIGSLKYSIDVMKRKYSVEPHILKFADFKQWRRKQVLEIGCGIGTDTIQFARAGAYVTAIDLSNNSLEVARRRLISHGIRGVLLLKANVEELSTVLDCGVQYDLVYAFGVLHHTPDPKAALAQIYKLMKPGAVLKVMLYNKWSWKRIAALMRGESVQKHAEAQENCPIANTYTRRESEALVIDYIIERNTVHHIFQYKIAEYKRYKYVKHWYFRILPMTLLERILGWHRCITARKPYETV